jgi:hypothetical protein
VGAYTITAAQGVRMRIDHMIIDEDVSVRPSRLQIGSLRFRFGGMFARAPRWSKLPDLVGVVSAIRCAGRVGQGCQARQAARCGVNQRSGKPAAKYARPIHSEAARKTGLEFLGGRPTLPKFEPGRSSMPFCMAALASSVRPNC